MVAEATTIPSFDKRNDKIYDERDSAEAELRREFKWYAYTAEEKEAMREIVERSEWNSADVRKFYGIIKKRHKDGVNALCYTSVEEIRDISRLVDLIDRVLEERAYYQIARYAKLLGLKCSEAEDEEEPDEENRYRVEYFRWFALLDTCDERAFKVKQLQEGDEDYGWCPFDNGDNYGIIEQADSAEQAIEIAIDWLWDNRQVPREYMEKCAWRAGRIDNSYEEHMQSDPDYMDNFNWECELYRCDYDMSDFENEEIEIE